MSKLLDQITIIIPTYNRDFYISRSIQYISSLGFSSIKIADSSDDEKRKKHREYVEKLNNPAIEFYEYPPDISPFDKFHDILNQTTTTYVLFCSDKDFPIAGGVEQAIDFLDKNPDYSVVDGHYFRTQFVSSRLTFHDLYSTYHFSLQSESPLQRVYTFMSDYFAVFYAVHRTELSKKSFNNYSDTFRGNFEPQFGELIPGFLDLCYGKYKRLDTLYWIRSFGPSSNSTTLVLDTYAKSNKLSMYYRLYDQLLTDAILETEIAYDAEYIHLILKCSFTNYLTKTQMRPEGYDYIDPDTLRMQNPLFILYKKIIRRMRSIEQFIDQKKYRGQGISHCNSDAFLKSNRDVQSIKEWTLNYIDDMEKDRMIPFENPRRNK